MRAETCPLDIFGFADRFRREIVGRILDNKRLPSAKLGDKPLKPRGKRTQGRGLDPFYGRRRDNDKRAVVLKFPKCAAIEPEKLPESGLRDPDFHLDQAGRDVGHSHGEIGEHSLECQQLFDRRNDGRRTRNCRRCNAPRVRIALRHTYRHSCTWQGCACDHRLPNRDYSNAVPKQSKWAKLSNLGFRQLQPTVTIPGKV